MRLSVGAVQVISGNMKYFDTAKQFVGPEHVMASGALPPGFPPIEIDNEPYWDGGLVSNTPLEYVLERTGSREDMVIFQVDLFSARGCMPQTLFDIGQREKEIRYSSRTRLNTDMCRAIRRLRVKVPEELCDNPDWRLLDSVSCNAAVTILLLIHRRAAYWTQSNDYEFSRNACNPLESAINCPHVAPMSHDKGAIKWQSESVVGPSRTAKSAKLGWSIISPTASDI